MPRPRGVCSACGREHVMRQDGTIAAHAAGYYCGQVAGEHNHALCVAKYGAAIVANNPTGARVYCPGSGRLPERLEPVWDVQVAKPKYHGYELHFGFPSRTPFTTIDGIYMPARDHIMSTYFPGEALDAELEGPIHWELVCRRGEYIADKLILGCHRASQYTFGISIQALTCTACRFWAHTSPRSIPYRSRPEYWS